MRRLENTIQTMARKWGRMEARNNRIGNGGEDKHMKMAATGNGPKNKKGEEDNLVKGKSENQEPIQASKH